MSAGRYDLTIEQGATLSIPMIWQNEDGTAVNLSGYTLAGKIRRKVTDPSALVSFTITVTNAANGAFTVSLTATQTGSLPISNNQDLGKENLNCVYDIEATTGSTVYRILEGLAIISPQVTK